MKVFITLISAILLTSSASAQSPADLKRFTDSWAKQNKVFVTASARRQLSEKFPSIAKYPTGEPARRDARAKTDVRLAAFALLEKFPTIHLTVQPVPPIDYTVAINGQDCPPDRGAYKVPVGNFEIQVVRSGKPPCLQKGILSEGETRAVACKL
jgi:hypothetical protein